MTEPLLACTVRGCGLPLTRSAHALTCANGHTFDIARSGYINLLQPQDRKSTDAGDSKQAVEARGRLLDAHVGRALVEAMVALAATLDLPGEPQVADLGSGSGHLLAALATQQPIRGIGIDLSTAAADHAARRFPQLTWVVANADRRLPIPDDSTSLVLSVHARRNPVECARVLQPSGWLLAAVPADEDLVELRTAIQGAAPERSRADAFAAEHDALFEVITRLTVRERHRLDPSQLRDLLASTYRGARLSMSPRVQALEALDVTLASDLMALRRR